MRRERHARRGQPVRLRRPERLRKQVGTPGRNGPATPLLKRAMVPPAISFLYTMKTVWDRFHFGKGAAVGGDSFLAPTQEQLFKCRGRFVPRTFQKDPRIQPESGSTAIINAIRPLLNDGPASRLGFFRDFRILVRPHDGMSWTAEWLRTEIAGAFPGFEIWALRGRRGSGELPAITRGIGESSLLAAAVEHGLVKPFFDPLSPRTIAVIAAAAAVATLP